MKISAFGTALLMDGTPVAQINGIGGPDLSLDTDDVTTHDQTEPWEEHVATILRSGEVTFDIFFDPNHASHTMLWQQMQDREEIEWELQFPDDAFTSWIFDGYVTGLSPDAPHSGALAGSVTIKITGEPTLDAVYSP